MSAARPKHREFASAWLPEVLVAVLGFLTAFVWEMWQMPFYETRDLSVMAAVKGCSMGAIGDAGILVGAYAFSGWLTRDRRWFLHPSARQIIIYLAAGLAVTIVIEQLALRSRLGWAYSDRMATDPLLGTGLVPIAMWIALPLVVLFLVRGLSTRRSVA